MSDTPKPERHIEVKLINSGRVLRTQALGEYADKMFDSMMRSILNLFHAPRPSVRPGGHFYSGSRYRVD